MADQLMYYIPGAASIVLAVLVIFSECSRISRRRYFKAKISKIEQLLVERDARITSLENESFRYHAKGRERDSKGRFINDDNVDKLEG